MGEDEAEAEGEAVVEDADETGVEAPRMGEFLPDSGVSGTSALWVDGMKSESMVV